MGPMFSLVSSKLRENSKVREKIITEKSGSERKTWAYLEILLRKKRCEVPINQTKLALPTSSPLLRALSVGPQLSLLLLRSGSAMDKMSKALEKAKMLVGMEVDEEQAAAAEEATSSSFYDDFNRDCTLSTKQVYIS